MIKFPLNPVLNQIFTHGLKTWFWNGVGWILTPTFIETDPIYMGDKPQIVFKPELENYFQNTGGTIGGYIAASGFTGDGSTLINIPLSGITNLQNELLDLFNQITGETNNRVLNDENLSGITDNLNNSFTGHTGDTNNPHNVTASQVGSYTTGETNTLLDSKSDTGHTHEQYLTGYTETNPGVYTSGQTDELLLGKSDTGHTHDYLPLSGGTLTDNLNITGTLNVYGSIIQSGTTWETHANQVYTSGDTIILRDGAINGLPPSGFTGIVAKKYDNENDGVLVFDSNGVARVGDMDIVNWTGTTQAIATREDSPLSNGFAYWDSGTTKFNTKILIPTDVSGLTDEYVTISSFTGHTSNTNNPHSTTASQVGAYTTGETNTLLDGKSDTGHTHDDRYYTTGQTDTLLSGKSNTGHTHDYLPLSGGTLYGSLSGTTFYGSGSGLINIPISGVTNLQTSLDNKSDTGHTHTNYVPYTGATQSVDLGNNTIKTSGVKLDTVTPYIVQNPGEIGWNSVDGTFDMKLLNGTTLQSGQELHFYGKAVGNISNRDVIQFAGVQGDHFLIKIAVPSEINEHPEYLMGVATNNIANGEFGYVTAFGKINDVYTTGWTLETPILYFDFENGGMTNVQPQAPTRRIILASVVKLQTGNDENGKIFVRPTFGCKISDLDDVNGTPLTTTGQILVWDNDRLVFDFTHNINDYLTTTGATATFTTISDFTGHTENNNNPHSVTASQVGAYTTGETNTLLLEKSDTGHTHDYLPLSGGTLTDSLNITGTLNVYGDIIQSGTTWETHANQVYTSGDTIILRDGAINGLPSSGYTGIVAKLYDGVNDGVLVFDNNGIARVGDMDIVNWTGTTQAIATREDIPLPNGFAYWDSGTTKFNTKALTLSDISGSTEFLDDRYVNVTGDTINGNLTVSGDTNLIGNVSGTTFYGSGAGLNNVPASGVTGLNLNQITSGSTTASVNLSGFTVSVSGSTLFEVSETPDQYLMEFTDVSGNTIFGISELEGDTLFDVIDTNDNVIYSVSNDGTIKQNSVTIIGLTSDQTPYNVLTVSKTSCDGLYFDYVIRNTITNAMKIGTIFCVQDGTNLTYTTYGSDDLNGVTSGITLVPQIVSSNIILIATVTTGTWTIKIGSRKL